MDFTARAPKGISRRLLLASDCVYMLFAEMVKGHIIHAWTGLNVSLLVAFACRKT